MTHHQLLSNTSSSSKRKSLITWMVGFFAILYGLVLSYPHPQWDIEEHGLPPARQFMGLDPTDTTNAMPLTGLVVAITGATSGIGYQVTKHLTDLGAHVIAIGRSASKLQWLQRQLTHGSNLTTVIADLADLESVANAANEIRINHSHVDVLINNAGMHAGLQGMWHHQATKQGYDMVFGGTCVVGGFSVLPMHASRITADLFYIFSSFWSSDSSSQ